MTRAERFIDGIQSLVPYAERIKSSGLPTFLYGMGDGAEKIFAYLTEQGVHFDGVVASDGFVRGQSFLGHSVISVSDAEAKHGKLCLVVCFGLEGDKADILPSLAKKHLLISPNLPVIGGGACDREFILAHCEEIKRISDLLADELSRDVFFSVLEYNITGDISLLEFGPQAEEAPEEYFVGGGIFVDVGAYNGDTVAEYTARNPHCGGIIAFEPDKKTFLQLQKNTQSLKNIQLINKCASDKPRLVTFGGGKGRGSHIGDGGHTAETESIDNATGFLHIGAEGAPVSAIKIDAEGEDERVLCGSANTLWCCKSNVCVAVYHRAGDIFEIPMMLIRFGNKYKYYFRKKKYIPAWDIFFYALNH